MTDKDSLPRREMLSETKRLLLEKRLQGGQPEKPASETIQRRPAGEPAPLSYAQERLWFLYQLNPNSSAYNMHDALRIRGSLDLPALERSLNLLVGRHEVLRSTFTVQDGQLAQAIAPRLEMGIWVHDLEWLSPAARERELQRLAVAEAQHRFDLAQGPLLRLTLARLSPEEHALFLTIHHILSDEWSNKVFWRELSALYGALTAGVDAALPPLPVQYADFAYWQRTWLQDDVLQEQIDYWKGRLGGSALPGGPALLGGALPILQLPIDRSRPAVQTFHGALQSTTLPVEAAERLRELGRGPGATLFMTLLAVFMTLLYRCSGQTGILVGTPIANRTRPELENLMGIFLNTLVLRADLSGADLSEDPSFMDLLEQVRQAALEAFAHGDLPFEKLVKELKPERDLSANPIFQVMFVHQEDPAPVFDPPGLAAEPMQVDGGVAKFDLTLFTYDTPRGLEVAIEYSTDLFEAGTIQRMLDRFGVLVGSILAQPHRPLSELPLLTVAERQQVLVDWNRTRAEYPRDACIHTLIEAWAGRTPQAAAVKFRGQTLTYAELEGRSNRLAHYLRRLGVKPGSLVGLCVERSLEMVVGFLGILKAGGAYVPLDPAYPKERLALVLADVGAEILLTQSHLVGDLPSGDLNLIALDGDWPDSAAMPAGRPVNLACPEDLAYVIYTSGSTGAPKGVPVTHRNLVASTQARLDYYPEPVGRFLLLSSIAFDSSVAGIYGSLCGGGALCLPEQRQEQDVSAIAELIEAYGITDMLCLPSLYSLLLEFAGQGPLSSLKTVIVAGEACTAGLVDLHFRRLPGASLYNEYGPTEGTVWSTVYKVPPDFGRSSVPIGRPIPNMRTYILDPHLQPVPIGVAGELYIAGEGLVQGYFNRPDLTAERFLQFSLDDFGSSHEESPSENQDRPSSVVHRPSSFVPGLSSIYRTGDLARYLPDGNIEFLGRADHQVKLRGYRIELEEIEAALQGYPSVQGSVVVARQERAAQENRTPAPLSAGKDDEALLAQLASLGETGAEALLSGIEALSDAEVDLILESEIDHRHEAHTL